VNLHGGNLYEKEFKNLTDFEMRNVPLHRGCLKYTGTPEQMSGQIGSEDPASVFAYAKRDAGSGK